MLGNTAISEVPLSTLSGEELIIIVQPNDFLRGRTKVGPGVGFKTSVSSMVGEVTRVTKD